MAKEVKDRTEIRYDCKRTNITGAREELKSIEWEKALNGIRLITPGSGRIVQGTVEIWSLVKRSSKIKKMWLTYKALTTGVGLDRIFIFVVSDPSILPIWPLLIAL